jgi:hypothetical protein
LSIGNRLNRLEHQTRHIKKNSDPQYDFSELTVEEIKELLNLFDTNQEDTERAKELISKGKWVE